MKHELLLPQKRTCERRLVGGELETTALTQPCSALVLGMTPGVLLITCDNPALGVSFCSIAGGPDSKQNYL